jgi:hypothetical protein
VIDLVKYVPKKYRCNDCGREQYTNDHCYGCKGNSFTGLNSEKDFNYEQAWKDLKNVVIDMLTDKESGVLYPEDLRKAMDEMLIDYMK